MSADSVRQLWQKSVDIYEQSEDYFQQFEGSMSSPIAVRTDLSKGAGATLNITTRAGYYGEGKSGDGLFTEATDFEEDLINNYKLKVDYLRNATRHTKRTEELMGMRNEIVDGTVEQLGRWMGREKTARMMMLFRERGASDNLIVAGGKASEATLSSANGLVYDEIVGAASRLEPMGGRPAMLGRVNGVDIYRLLVIGTTPGLFSLETDPTYKEHLEQAGVLGEGNKLFTGGFSDVRGNRICKYNPIDHDGHGPVGSAWNAKAFLGTAIAAGTTAFDITGGGSAAAAAKTNKKYFKFFAGSPFEFMPGDTITTGSTVKYLLIVNPKNAATDPGKIGMYSYTTGIDGNKITIVERLGSAASGARVTTLGSVVWNTGVWSGLHTDVHPIGATIVQCNAKGVPIGDTVLLGNAAALRGYGEYRNFRSQDEHNGGFVMDKYITSVFGQCLRKDTQGRAPGYVRIRHALNYAGLGLPAVA
jgi:hypothetical protein